MLELLCLAASGALIGAALSARRSTAPRWVPGGLAVLAALALLCAVVLLLDSTHP